MARRGPTRAAHFPSIAAQSPPPPICKYLPRLLAFFISSGKTHQKAVNKKTEQIVYGARNIES